MPSSARLEIPCPGCGRVHEVDPEALHLRGQPLRCRRCGEVVLEAVSASGAPPRAEISRAVEAPTEPTAGTVRCPACGHDFLPAGQGDPRHLILVVEDTEYFMTLARDVLDRRYRTVGARTAAEALAVLEHEPVDLLVLDLTRPDAEGAEVLARSPRRDLPVLIFTSKSEDEMLGEAWERLRGLGADDLLIKSVSMEEQLLQKVDALLDQRSETSEPD